MSCEEEEDISQTDSRLNSLSALVLSDNTPDIQRNAFLGSSVNVGLLIGDGFV